MKFDFMGYRKQYGLASAILCLVALGICFTHGLNYGIDFKGGNIIHVRFNGETSETAIREVFGSIKDLYFTPEQLIIQNVAGGQNKEFVIQYPAPLRDTAENAQMHVTIQKTLKEKIPFIDDALETANVGPTVGDDMKRQGIWAAILSVVGILLYLAWRFEIQSATGAVVALIHDLCLTLGFISITGIEFDVTVLAAILTMLGYSVNDSIVVLDRIRENRRIMRDVGFSALINDSVNSTLGRTINTSLTTLFTLVALLLKGGSSIHGFSATLTFGIAVGTYSSIFISAVILLEMTGDKLERKRR